MSKRADQRPRTNLDASPALDACPCGAGPVYLQCCGRYHAGGLHLQAPSPEALMRSRYSAFVKNVNAYLLDTWYESTKPNNIEAPEPGLKWLGLTVQESRLLSPIEGTVSFVARYKIGGRAFRLEELSRFVHERGQWWYVSALDA